MQVNRDKVADRIQEAKHVAQGNTAKSAAEKEWDLEAYWRAYSEGLQKAENIVRDYIEW